MKLLAATFLMCGGLGWGQAPPHVFELQIPEFQDKAFDSDVVEVPLTRLKQLVIHVLSPVGDTVSYGKIYPRLNGDAASVISQFRATGRGKAVYMDLVMRPNLRLRPGANTLEVTAINARGRRYYKNWILRTRETSRNEWFSYDYSLAARDEDAVEPDVVITEPEFPIVLEPGEARRKVRLKGSATSINPIASIRLPNEPPIAKERESRIEFDKEITVTSKDKELSVEAADVNGNRARVTIPVVISNAQSQPRFNGDRYALVVGISRYGAGKGGPPAVPAAAVDAEHFASSLISKAGFEKEHVLLLRDEQASSVQIKNAFRNFVAQARRDDLLLVYFAGQGLHDPTNPDKIFLAAHDTQLSLLEDTALDVGELESLVSNNIRSQHAVLFFDVARKLTDEWQAAGNNLVNAYLSRLFSKEQGRAVMVSSSIRETSLERHTDGAASGLFTDWISEGLTGAADWNRDHIVTVGELFQYVKDRVTEESKGSQVPRYQIAEQALPLTRLIVHP